MHRKLTRREAARLLGAAAPALGAAAPQSTGSQDDDLAIQRNNLKRNWEALAKIKIPVELEPAFQFKA